MLIGKSYNNVDSKGRLFIPVKWRADLGDKMYLLYDFGSDDSVNYLQIMTEEKFSAIRSTVSRMHPADLSFDRAIRYIFPNAEELNPDKQGRILIPQGFLEYAGLGSEVVLLGLEDRVEIWDPEKYRQEMSGYTKASFTGDMQKRASADNSKQNTLSER